MNRYKDSHSLYDLKAVKTQRSGQVMFVLVSLHDNRSDAKQAAAEIEQRTGSTPWVRSIAGLQKIAIE